jgi:hypothetical protein
MDVRSCPQPISSPRVFLPLTSLIVRSLAPGLISLDLISFCCFWKYGGEGIVGGE